MVQNAASRSGQTGPVNRVSKSAAVTPGNITTLATVVVDFAFAGVAPGDIPTVSPSTAPLAGVQIGQPYILGANVVKVPFFNITAGTLNQTAITLNVAVAKKL
jgi:hypothetical protein